MTEFINAEKIEKAKQKKLTLFTHVLQADKSLGTTEQQPSMYEKVVYLGYCIVDGDMFAAHREGSITIYKGEKGDEFND